MSAGEGSGAARRGLSEAKRRLLEQRLHGRRGRLRPEDDLTAGPPDAPAPLSPAQRGIWWLQHADPDSVAYHLAAAFRVDGALDLGALREAVATLAERHRILASAFRRRAGSGEPEIVADGAAPTVERVAPAGVEAGPPLAERARRLARRPFDLARGPLLRVSLLEAEGEEGAMLLLAAHHLVLDEWSLGLLLDELARCYRAAVAGHPAELEPLPIQFADYARWRSERLAGGLAEEQLAWWRRRLAGPLPAGALPTDLPRSAAASERALTARGGLDGPTVERLQTLAAAEDASLSMALLTVWLLLVQKTAGDDDVLVATPVADRRRAESRGLVGYLLDTVLLRTDLSGDPTVREALRRVRATQLDAFAHRDVPFGRIVRELSPPRPPGGQPFTQLMYVFQRPVEGAAEGTVEAVRDGGGAIELPGAVLRPAPLDLGAAKVDFTLFARPRDDGVETLAEARADLFEAATVERLLRRYELLAEQAAAAPEQPISRLDPLGPEERSLVLADWQGGELAVDGEPLVHRAFAARAAATPDAPAVIPADGDALSYAALAGRAHHLAGRLQELGVERGEPVAVDLERSPEALAGILGILAAGAAYLPVDPAWPAERRRLMLGDAGARRALVRCGAAGEIAQAVAATVAVDDPDSTAGEPPPPADPAGPDDLAYVIYTSGSTGRPKGVMVTHDALRSSTAARPAFYREPPERFLLLPSLSFDSSVAGIFWTLASGGALVLPGPGEAADPVALARLIRRHRVTHLLAIPGLYRHLLARDPADLASLRTAIVAGEPCPPELVARHRRLLPGVELVNEYGPTEGTVWATAHRCGAGDEGRPVPIGRPIANTRVWVLDRRGRPVPPGVAGQLHLVGRGLAAGYLGREGLTRERFPTLRPPGVAEPARTYATGDRGRWRADGALEFLGRLDEQVKVRGHRIEPGEIEAALAEHPAVGEAAVAVVGGGADDPSGAGGDGGSARIVAFHLPPAGAPAGAAEGETGRPSAGELRAFLARSLPEFMLPAAFVAADELPRQPNGKLDRRALAERARGAGAGVDETPLEPPAGPVEAQLARIWHELLEVREVGRDSHFFRLGGHSLLLLELIERVRRELGVELPVGVLFEAPTLRGLAEVVAGRLADSGRPTPSWSPLVEIRGGGGAPPLYLVHGVTGEVSPFYALADQLPAGRPLWALQAPPEPMDEMVPMAARYVEELRRHQPGGPYLLAGYCLGGCVAYEMARQLHAAGGEVALLALIDSVPPEAALERAAPRAAVLARRLRRFASKGPREAVAAIAGVLQRGNLRRAVAGEDRGALTLDELLAGMPPAYREATEAHYRALADYRPGPWPGDLHLLRGPDLHLAADYGWAALAEGEVRVEEIEGRHTEVFREPQVRGLAGKLAAMMEDLE